MPEARAPKIRAARVTMVTVDAVSCAAAVPDDSNVVGRLLLLAAGLGDDVTANIVFPSGWTELGQGLIGNSLARFGTAYRFVDGTEGLTGSGDTVTLTNENSDAVKYAVRVFSIHGATKPPEIAQASAGASSHNPPAVVPSWGHAYNLAIIAAGHNASGNNPSYVPSYDAWRDFSHAIGDGLNTVSIQTMAKAVYDAAEDPELGFTSVGSDTRVHTILVAGLVTRTRHSWSQHPRHSRLVARR